MSEPTALRAGDPWSWTRDDLTSTYPATEWSLSYWFKNAAGGFEVAAVADGAAFAVAESSDDTQGLAAGAYAWQARVSNIATPSTRHVVDSGSLTVLPNLFVGSATDALDARSQAQKAYDDAKTALASFQASNGRVKSYQIAGRAMEFASSEELVVLVKFWENEVTKEAAANAKATGRPNPRRYYARMSNG